VHEASVVPRLSRQAGSPEASQRATTTRSMSGRLCWCGGGGRGSCEREACSKEWRAAARSRERIALSPKVHLSTDVTSCADGGMLVPWWWW